MLHLGVAASVVPTGLVGQSVPDTVWEIPPLVLNTGIGVLSVSQFFTHTSKGSNMAYSADQPLRIRDAIRYVESRSGKRLSVQTMYRWMTKGLRGRRLAFSYIGGTRYVSPKMLEDFFDAVTTAAVDGQVVTPTDASATGSGEATVIVRTSIRPQSRNREAEIARADAELRRDGI